MKYIARVLVVDDEDRFRSNMLAILKKDGQLPQEAADGASALALLEEQDFDVILLDLKMDGLPGEKVLEIIKEREMPAEVIILTGHADINDAVELVIRGAFDVIIKPAETMEILRKIQLACEKKLLDEGAISFKEYLHSSL